MWTGQCRFFGDRGFFGGVMDGANWLRGWRRAIGLIAAYALVLQAFLAYSIASQAAGQGSAALSGVFFVLCASQDNAEATDISGAVKPNTHCPICTLSRVGSRNAARAGFAAGCDPRRGSSARVQMRRTRHCAAAGGSGGASLSLCSTGGNVNNVGSSRPRRS
jgi:hypothetical protein